MQAIQLGQQQWVSVPHGIPNVPKLDTRTLRDTPTNKCGT